MLFDDIMKLKLDVAANLGIDPQTGENLIERISEEAVQQFFTSAENEEQTSMNSGSHHIWKGSNVQKSMRWSCNQLILTLKILYTSKDDHPQR